MFLRHRPPTEIGGANHERNLLMESDMERTDVMTNGIDDVATPPPADNATAVKLACVQLVDAAEDFVGWAVLAQAVLEQLEDQLGSSIEDEALEEHLLALRSTLEGQHQRTVAALVAGRTALGEIDCDR